MTQQQNTLMKLQTDLSKFGLNPSEWTLKKVQSVHYLIINKIDASFALYGQLALKKNTPTWKSIDLVTI